MNWALNPTTKAPSRFAGNLANRIDPPTGEGGFMRGLLAGGVEGIGDLVSDSTSPIGLAAMAVPGLSGMMKGARSMRKAAPTLDLIEPSPVKQINPSMDDVGSLIGDMKRQLARIPARKSSVTQGIDPAKLPMEMVPRGGEAAYNAARMPVAPRNIDDILYEMMMSSQARRR